MTNKISPKQYDQKNMTKRAKTKVSPLAETLGRKSLSPLIVFLLRFIL